MVLQVRLHFVKFQSGNGFFIINLLYLYPLLLVQNCFSSVSDKVFQQFYATFLPINIQTEQILGEGSKKIK